MAQKRKDGQPAKLHSNRYVSGSEQRRRVDKTLAFKPKIEIAEAIFKDIEEKKISTTEWLDLVVEEYFKNKNSQ